MGALIDQKPIKLVVSLIFKDDMVIKKTEDILRKKYGEFDSHERTLPFDFTDYYDKEFGKPLKRKLMCFKKPVNKEKIADIKIATNRIEARFRKKGNRTVNIDPGYITEAKLVLLTTKDYTHRVYVGKRVFAESTLFFQDGTFKPWPWTYPDYASEELISYFNKVRDLYIKEMRGESSCQAG
ncbi:DUF4416 family protein [Candidatus Omnitrophota bacterium]